MVCGKIYYARAQILTPNLNKFRTQINDWWICFLVSDSAASKANRHIVTAGQNFTLLCPGAIEQSPIESVTWKTSSKTVVKYKTGLPLLENQRVSIKNHFMKIKRLMNFHQILYWFRIHWNLDKVNFLSFYSLVIRFCYTAVPTISTNLFRSRN